MRVLLALLPLAACHPSDPVEPKVPKGPTDPGVFVEPGSKPLHRLNQAELDNTVRDLFGTELRPSDRLPADEISNGFDNNAAGLTITSTHIELLEVGFDEVLDELFGFNLEQTEMYGFHGEGPGVAYLGVGQPFEDWAYAVQEGSITSTLSVAYDGTFEISFTGFGRAVEGVLPFVGVDIDGERVATFEVGGSPSMIEEHTFDVALNDGVHTFAVVLDNPYTGADNARRSVTVDGVFVEGPLDPRTGPSDAYDEIMFCNPATSSESACAEDVLAALMPKVWRRPVPASDVAWAMGLYDAARDVDESWEAAIRLAVKGTLLAPEFLYRLEQDPAGDDAARALDAHEVASRLSYFLWSSMPDDELRNAADSGTLLEPGGVEAQVDRMLLDARSAALVDNLAGQWLDVRTVAIIAPDTAAYPEFDEALRASMQQEISFLVEDFLAGRDDVSSLLTRRQTWIDQRLAEHYGMPFDANETGFVQTPLDGTPRLGLLGTAGWLAAHSHADSPSAVRRGKWILENLLCSAPPPPPPDVEAIGEFEPSAGSVREQEEAFRSDSFCQGCHSLMDPMGFVLGGFDALGAEREFDELGYPIDATAVVAGQSVSDLETLAALVLEDPGLPRCVANKTLTYALGRAVDASDDPIVTDISDQFVAGGNLFPALAKAIATSPAFLMRGQPTEEAP